MEAIKDWLPLVQFMVAIIIIPLWKTIRNQETQIGQLKEIITSQQKQIDLLEAIVLESSDAEIVKKHLIKRGNHGG
ncbi:MAG: hypothetical protein CJD30_03550 [Sulfuricurvum sp. PD_MW2]|uniref:hypothetical protein n=1 Tax=Sulfuricurvum sp. PD_MW2 TaxID=2027917 RepID=UPI000C062CFB|nr:hypothetical protein [Sulfuricurvum sp. PD_MW2]PHM18048.1 MAG: hypothetical protein CJD30_03550 [Sulfuricurvum sp. PD_MW2]